MTIEALKKELLNEQKVTNFNSPIDSKELFSGLLEDFRKQIVPLKKSTKISLFDVYEALQENLYSDVIFHDSEEFEMCLSSESRQIFAIGIITATKLMQLLLSGKKQEAVILEKKLITIATALGKDSYPKLTEDFKKTHRFMKKIALAVTALSAVEIIVILCGGMPAMLMIGGILAVLNLLMWATLRHTQKKHISYTENPFTKIIDRTNHVFFKNAPPNQRHVPESNLAPQEDNLSLANAVIQ